MGFIVVFGGGILFFLVVSIIGALITRDFEALKGLSEKEF